MPITTLRYVGITPTDNAAAAARATEIATAFADFIKAAQASLDIAIYHFNLSGAEAPIVLGALQDAVARNVTVRVAYYDEKPRGDKTMSHHALGGGDWEPDGLAPLAATGVQMKPIYGLTLETLPPGVTERPVEGSNLMHSKYMIADQKSVWTGTGNFTTEAWSLQDNNFVLFSDEPQIAEYYGDDFFDLWNNGTILKSGTNDRARLTLSAVDVEVDFSPGDGIDIEGDLADLVSNAQSSVQVASMVISSARFMDALIAAKARGIAISGIYDEGQMDMVTQDWDRAVRKSGSAKSQAKLDQWNQVKTSLVAKHSRRYSPHADTSKLNFMHCKTLVVDSQIVLTGSFNFSENAARNAENIVILRNPGIASDFAAYISKLVDTYK